MHASTLESIEAANGTPRVGVALQAVMDIVDRVAIGYETLPRPAMGIKPASIVDEALATALHAAPAVVFILLPARLLSTPEFDPIALVRARGAIPSEIAWTIRNMGTARLDPVAAYRLKQLRGAGFRFAVDGVSLAAIDQSLVAHLRPDFVFLDPRLPGRLRDDVAKAELAATVAFAARLGGRLIARGVDGAAKALAVADLGVQYGVGPYLAPPVVLHASLAAPGDELVPTSWFRRHEVRIIKERGEALDAPLVLRSVIPPSTQDIDERSFARALGEAARTLQAEHDPGRILNMAAELLLRVMPADRLAIFEADWQSHQLVPRVAAGHAMEGLAGMDNSMNEGITGWVFARGLPYNCADADRHPGAATIPGTERFEESLLAIPLVAGDHRLGMLDVWRNGLNRFSEEDLERCALFGFITAAAWRSAQLYAELERRALTDALTGLFNVRWWNEVAPRDAALSLRSGTDIGILLIDLDHFKQINDRAGHAAGDTVLRRVARALRGVIREVDAAVRYGGEEFLLMLPGSGSSGAMQVAQKVRAALAELPSPTPSLPTVTASIGVAVFPQHGRNLDDVVRAADLAMYAAKQAGRDGIALASAPAPA